MLVVVLALTATSLGVACASSPAEKVVAPAPEAKPEPRSHAAPEMSSSIGGLNQDAVEATFASLDKAVQACVTSGSERVEALGGGFTVHVRIATDGSLSSAYMRTTTLGDRETEQCVLDAARARTWPKPLGGEGEAEHDYRIEAGEEATLWTQRRLRPLMKTIYRKVAKCLSPHRGRWQATMYIRRDGRVASAGVAPPNAKSDGEQAECLVDAMRAFQFGRQRPRYSKVTFTIP